MPDRCTVQSMGVLLKCLRNSASLAGENGLQVGGQWWWSEGLNDKPKKHLTL